MEKLTQLDVDKLEAVTINIDLMIENIESIIYDERVDKVKLAYFLGKLSNELHDEKNTVQDVINTINDKDLIEVELYDMRNRESFLDEIEDDLKDWDENWPDDIDNETTDELPF